MLKALSHPGKYSALSSKSVTLYKMPRWRTLQTWFIFERCNELPSYTDTGPHSLCTVPVHAFQYSLCYISLVFIDYLFRQVLQIFGFHRLFVQTGVTNTFRQILLNVPKHKLIIHTHKQIQYNSNMCIISLPSILHIYF